MRIKGKNVSWILYILGILGLVFFAVILSGIVIPDKNSISDNLILERTKLIISILGPTLTLVVFIRTIQIQLESSKNLIRDNVSKDFYNLLNLFTKIQGKLEYKDFTNLNDSISKKMDKLGENLSLRNNNDTCKKVNLDLKTDYLTTMNKELDGYSQTLNNYFINAYYQFGSYLKVFHRILKLLNSKYESNDISYQDYRMYIGILRGQIENYEFYIIFINALFTNRGTGMGVELIKTSFFGDDLDISLKQHFSHPDFLEDVLKEYFIEDTKRYKSIIERKNIRETYKKRNKESNLLSLLKVEYKLDSGKSIQISNGIKS
ncbi:hypothetical protein IGJ01_002788 [Enterococcus sp. AZ089]|uniref:Phage abortive infection protein n=3 Tax=Enterococcus TaxID=1350 RepID=A0ABV3MGU6_9ENTE